MIAALHPIGHVERKPEERDAYIYLWDAGKALETARANYGDERCVDLNIEVAERAIKVAKWIRRGRPEGEMPQ